MKIWAASRLACRLMLQDATCVMLQGVTRGVVHVHVACHAMLQGVTCGVVLHDVACHVML